MNCLRTSSLVSLEWTGCGKDWTGVLEPGPEGWVELIGVGERNRWGELEVWGNEKLA